MSNVPNTGTLKLTVHNIEGINEFRSIAVSFGTKSDLGFKLVGFRPLVEPTILKCHKYDADKSITLGVIIWDINDTGSFTCFEISEALSDTAKWFDVGNDIEILASLEFVADK